MDLNKSQKENTRYDLNIAFLPVFIILITEFIVDTFQSGIINIFSMLKILIPLIIFIILKFSLKNS